MLELIRSLHSSFSLSLLHMITIAIAMTKKPRESPPPAYEPENKWNALFCVIIIEQIINDFESANDLEI